MCKKSPGQLAVMEVKMNAWVYKIQTIYQETEDHLSVSWSLTEVSKSTHRKNPSLWVLTSAWPTEIDNLKILQNWNRWLLLPKLGKLGSHSFSTHTVLYKEVKYVLLLFAWADSVCLSLMSCLRMRSNLHDKSKGSNTFPCSWIKYNLMIANNMHINCWI